MKRSSLFCIKIDTKIDTKIDIKIDIKIAIHGDRIKSVESDGNANVGENHYIHLTLLPCSFEAFRGISARYS